MNAKELRIGNWVNSKTPSGFVDDQVSCGAYLDLVGIIETKPITLTEEWLVMLGFEKISGWDDYKGCIKDFVELECDTYGFEFANCIDKEVKHVHQLQNLYYALTGTELKKI